MKSVSHATTFVLPVSVEQLFPLFSPEGEKQWVPGWEYNNIMGTTELTEDYVFLTQTHDHAASEAIWLIKRYDPESYFIQFYKIEPDNKIGVISVDCTPLATDETEVEVAYKYIALSKRGETFVAEFTRRAYESFIAEWRELLMRYFRNQ